MRRINWANIVVGQTVKFRYKGKRPGAKSRLRECLVLNPRHMYTRKTDGKRVRLVHALQFTAMPPKRGVRNLQTKQVSNILEAYGDELVLNEANEVEALVTKPPLAAYQKVKRALRGIPYPVYKTFSWGPLQRNAVWVVDDLELTPAVQKKLISITPDIDELDI